MDSRQQASPWFCTLEFHDDAFSRESVILNTDRIPLGSALKIGALARVGPLKGASAHDELQSPQARDTNAELGSDTHTGDEKHALNSASKHARATRSGQSIPRTSQRRSVTFVIAPMTQKQALRRPHLQCSLHMSVRRVFGFSNRQQVIVSAAQRAANTATHVELVFRDQYLSRADQWQLIAAELSNKTVFRGQSITFMSSIKVTVRNIYVNNRKVTSALFSTSTTPVFRSESARHLYCIQMSQEMWDYDTEGSGELMFSKIVEGFFPDLFRRWQKAGVKHLISIILFARTEYEKGVLKTVDRMPSLDNVDHASKNEVDYRDHYKVIDAEVTNQECAKLLRDLKKQFRTFLRDIATVPRDEIHPRRPDRLSDYKVVNEQTGNAIVGKPTVASKGNILELVNVVATYFTQDCIDRDLTRTCRSMVILTAGAGMFEVDHDLLKYTTESLMSSSRSVELVTISPPPLHSVPLFRFRKPFVSFSVTQPGSAFGSLGLTSSTPRPSTATRLGMSQSPNKFDTTHDVLDTYSEWGYAVPHWLDMSVWSTDAISRSDRVAPQNVAKAEPSFTTSCRMHELQMMGLMESEMTDVTIPLLRLNTGEFASHMWQRLDQKRTISREVPVRELSGVSALSLRTSSRDDVAKEADTLSQELMSQWMDDYDSQAVKAASGEDDRVNNISPLEMHGISLQPQASLPASSRPPMAQQHISEHDFAKRKLLGMSADDRNKIGIVPEGPRRGSELLSSFVKSKASNPSRRVKVPRQISMGGRGLGPLKSTATISLSATSSTFTNPPDVHISERRLSTTSGLIAKQLKSTLSRKSSNSSLSTVASTRPQSLQQQSYRKGDGTSTPIAISQDLQPSSASTSGAAVPVPMPVSKRRSTTFKATPDAFSLGLPHTPARSQSLGRTPASFRDRALLSRRGTQVMSMSKWVTTLNPFNPLTAKMVSTAKRRRWQHVRPQGASRHQIKWRSLCFPSGLALSGQDLPSIDDLNNLYDESYHDIQPRCTDYCKTIKQARDLLFRQVIASRLCLGFRFVIGPDAELFCRMNNATMISPFQVHQTAVDDMIIMCTEATFHVIRCLTDHRLQIRRLTRHNSKALLTGTSYAFNVRYEARVRARHKHAYEKRLIAFSPPQPEYDWNTIDDYLCGEVREQTSSIPYVKARYILIPCEISRANRTSLRDIAEVSDEEVRLEGIQKLTQLWQRQRVYDEDELYNGARPALEQSNPLAIDYQTKDISAVVRAYVTDVPEHTRGEQAQHQAVEIFNVNDYDMHRLAQSIQAPPPRGIVIKDRRWHWHSYTKAFLGDEMTTWLLRHFKDVDTREGAVKIGNELMKKGVFIHVHNKHDFKDGNYFYQLHSAWRKGSANESRTGWFSRMTERSMPSTPGSHETGRTMSASPASGKAKSRLPGDVSTPSTGDHSLDVTRPGVIRISNKLRYDVDTRRRSWRPELVTVHYDQIHNPDDCYHIRLEWMNVTSKLIEDAIVSWASSVEKYGLKFMQIPIVEISKANEHNTFRGTHKIRPVSAPPSARPRSYFDASPLVAKHNEKFTIERALLRKWDFVLDQEAASAFEIDNTEVVHSYGVPDYEFIQYIHKSGRLIAQIDDEGNFLVVVNRMYVNTLATLKDGNKLDRTDKDRRAGMSSGRSPMASPLARPADMSASTTFGSVTGSNSSTPTLTTIDGGSSRRLASGKHPSAASFTEQMTGKVDPSAGEIAHHFERFCKNADALNSFYDEFTRQQQASQQQQQSQQSMHSSNMPAMATAMHAAGSITTSRSASSSAEPSPITHATIHPGSPRQHAVLRGSSLVNASTYLHGSVPGLVSSAAVASMQSDSHSTHPVPLQHRTMTDQQTRLTQQQLAHHQQQQQLQRHLSAYSALGNRNSSSGQLRPEAEIPTLGLPERLMPGGSTAIAMSRAAGLSGSSNAGSDVQSDPMAAYDARSRANSVAKPGDHGASLSSSAMSALSSMTAIQGASNPGSST